MTAQPWLLVLTASALACSSCASTPAADIVLKNGEIYTMEAPHPWARAIAVSGNTIVAVLDRDDDVARYVGEKTRVIDLGGRFVVPGFIDGHTHFSSAGALVNDANLMTVADDEGLRKEVNV